MARLRSLALHVLKEYKGVTRASEGDKGFTLMEWGGTIELSRSYVGAF